MFRYNSDTQTYSMSLFADRTEEGDFSTFDEKHKQMQEVALRSTYKIITEPEFHDLWFCETRDCESSFWLGGRHHCRMCGNTVCEEHCHTNVVLSTHLMPVIEDKLPNVTVPILAASRLDVPLPESLEFKRACLECCEKAKFVPIKLWIEEEKKRIRREQQEANDRERLSGSHWTADEELNSKINAMKAKKLAWHNTNTRRRKRQLKGEPMYDSEGEEYFPENGEVRPHKPLAEQIAERAEKRLQAARVTQEAALLATQERQAQLDAHEELISQQREETMTPAELALFRKKRERAKAESLKNEIASQVDSANAKMKVGMASVFFSIAKRAEIAAQQEQLRVVAEAAQIALSKSTRHLFDRLTLNKEFERAKSSGDETAKHVVAVALIGLAWQSKVDRRHRAALKEKRDALLRTVSLGRLQAWWRVMLAKIRALNVKQLKLNLQSSEEEIVRMRVLDLMNVHNMSGIRSIIFKLIGLVRMKLRLATLSRVLVVESIVCTAPAAKQHVIVHLQTGLSNLATVHNSGRTALLNKSKTECVYSSRSVGAGEEGRIEEKCVLAQVTGKSVIGVTLVNPDSYTQTLIQLDKYPTLLSGDTITITKPAIETTQCPIAHATSRKSLLPASNYTKSTKNNKKLISLPAVRTFRMHMLPHAFTHTGRVQKQANSLIGEFKSRFLVLAGGKLLYYDDQSVLHKPRGVIACESVTVFAFGPDKTAHGELTLYISDGTQHWYLRFPKAIGTEGTSTWLRKIQYNCKHVSLNNSHKSFLARIEQMTHVFTYPVLRPTAKPSSKSGVFGTSGAVNTNRDSIASTRNSTASSKAMVFGNSTSGRVSWSMFSRSGPSAAPRRDSNSSIEADAHSAVRGTVGTESVVHGRIINSTPTSSGVTRGIAKGTSRGVGSGIADDVDSDYGSISEEHSPSVHSDIPAATEHATESKTQSVAEDVYVTPPASPRHHASPFSTETGKYNPAHTCSAGFEEEGEEEEKKDDERAPHSSSNSTTSSDSTVNSLPATSGHAHHHAHLYSEHIAAVLGASHSSTDSTPARAPHDAVFQPWRSPSPVAYVTHSAGDSSALDHNYNEGASTDYPVEGIAEPKLSYASVPVTDDADFSVEHKHAHIDMSPAPVLVTRTATPTSDIISTKTAVESPTARSRTVSPKSSPKASITPSLSANTMNSLSMYQPRSNPLSATKRKSSGMFARLSITEASAGIPATESVESADDSTSIPVVNTNTTSDPTVNSADSNTLSVDASAVIVADTVTDSPEAAVSNDASGRLSALLRSVETVEWSDSEDEEELSNVNIHTAYSNMIPTSVSHAVRHTTHTVAPVRVRHSHINDVDAVSARNVDTPSPNVFAVPVRESSAVSANLITAHTISVAAIHASTMLNISEQDNVSTTSNSAYSGTSEVETEDMTTHNRSAPSTPLHTPEGSGKKSNKKKKNNKKK